MVPRQLLNEGKTKKIFAANNPGEVIVVSKDDITAGDGAKHDVIVGKAELANRTTCNVFKLLHAHRVPVAFIEQVDATSFRAERCNMILWEVVVRRLAYGSYLKRNPGTEKGCRFDDLVLEFFLKTTDKKWGEIPIPKDDPLAVFRDGQADLYLPDQPVSTQKPFLTLLEFPLSSWPRVLERMGEVAKQSFLILEEAWKRLDRELADYKVEFGLNPNGELRLADVIDNDSWRLLENGQHLDKQSYREGEEINEVTAKYRRVADLTDTFAA